jgi:small-conductance mechanosensitive channel
MLLAFNLFPEISPNITTACLITVGGLICYQLTFMILKRWSKKHKYFIPSVLQRQIYFPGLLLIFFIALYAALPFLGSYLHSTIYRLLAHITVVVIIFCSGFLLIRSIAAGRDIILRHYQSENPLDFTIRKARTKFQIIQRVLNFLIIIITIAAVLMTFQSIRQVGSTLLASAGVIGIVLGFAAQKSLGSLFAGIQIAISQPIRLDDVVIVEGQYGTIGEISLTYVIVKTWDGRRLVVPINYFLEKSFENWTRTSPEIVAKVKIYVDYSLPVDKLRSEFTKWLQESKLWDGRTSGLLVTDASERCLELRATMSARNSDDAFSLECMIREKLITYINEKYPFALPRSRYQLSENDRQTIQADHPLA